MIPLVKLVINGILNKARKAVAEYVTKHYQDNPIIMLNEKPLSVDEIRKLINSLHDKEKDKYKEGKATGHYTSEDKVFDLGT